MPDLMTPHEWGNVKTYRSLRPGMLLRHKGKPGKNPDLFVVDVVDTLSRRVTVKPLRKGGVVPPIEDLVLKDQREDQNGG